MTLQLEVGKKYLNREGEVVEIVYDRGSHYTHRYEGIDGETYTELGEMWEGETCMEDLISEYVEPSTKPVETTTKVPHKHKDLIIAWANGEAVETKNQITGEWYVHTDTPIFHEYYEYRIKPEKKVEVVRAWVSRDTAQVHVAKPNLSLTFEDGKLIKAEVL